MHRDLQDGAVAGELHHVGIDFEGINNHHDVKEKPDSVGDESQDLLQFYRKKINPHDDTDMVPALHAVAGAQINHDDVKNPGNLLLPGNSAVEEQSEHYADK